MLKEASDKEKDKLIMKVMNTEYKNDQPKYYNKNIAYLETLSVAELKKKLKD